MAVRPPVKLRLAVLPIDLDFQVSTLSHIETVPQKLEGRPLSKDDRLKIIDRKMAANMAWLREEFEKRFSNTYTYDVIADSSVQAALDAEGMGPDTDFWELRPEQVKSLAKRINADVVLKSRIVGYGGIKLKWFLEFMALDYTQDATGGFLVAQGSGNTLAGLATGGLWALVDTVNYTSAMFFLNKYFIPVIMRADLVSGADGRSLSSSTEVELSWELFVHDRRFLDQYPEAKRTLKQVRLKSVAAKAIDDLAGYFERKAIKNEADAKKWYDFL